MQFNVNESTDFIYQIIYKFKYTNIKHYIKNRFPFNFPPFQMTTALQSQLELYSIQCHNLLMNSSLWSRSNEPTSNRLSLLNLTTLKSCCWESNPATNRPTVWLHSVEKKKFLPSCFWDVQPAATETWTPRRRVTSSNIIEIVSETHRQSQWRTELVDNDHLTNQPVALSVAVHQLKS